MLALHALLVALIAFAGSAHATAAIPQAKRDIIPRTPPVCGCPANFKACPDTLGGGCCPEKSECFVLPEDLLRPQCLALPKLFGAK
ncbi:hypothetical protein BD779DRAFT_292543 [Infundibulicybe gibba]|nr:hypothetical protein BD779DRAFT_292543 [Infundibulicybe gibba]